MTARIGFSLKACALRTVQALALISISALLACGGGSSSEGSPAQYHLSGRIQKGPFTVGSAIAVNELDATLGPNGTVFNVQTSNALGDFSVPSAISAQQVEIIAEGFYFDELSGKLSASQIQLRAITDLSVDPSPTVNVLTTLQEQRLKTLVSQGNSFSAAYTQSQSEVLALFGINAADVGSLSTLYAMRVDGSTDADAVLLAASVILSQIATDAASANGTTQAAELSNLVNTVSAQLASTGTLSGSGFSTARDKANAEIDAAVVATNLGNYFTQNGVTASVPPFIEWVDQSNSGILPQRLVPVAGLSFSAVASASPGQLVTSNTVMVGGLGTGVVVPIAVNPSVTLLKNNVPVQGRYTTAQDGDSIALQVIAPGYSLSTTSNISAGSSSAAWIVTSQPLSGSVSGLHGTGLVLKINGTSLSVPAGSTTFSFSSPVADGAGYSVSVAAQPTSPLEVCSVSNGTGTVGAAPSNVSVLCDAQSGLLLVSGGEGYSGGYGATLYVYSIDAMTGVLMQIPGSPYRFGTAQYFSIAIDSSGKFAYVVDPNYTAVPSSNVSAYAINTATGALTAVAGSPFGGGSYPLGISADPKGNFVYIAGGNPRTGVSAFAIDPSTGALSLVTGSPFAGGNLADVVDPSGRFVYSVDLSQNLWADLIDPASGSLSAIGSGPIPAGNDGQQLVTDPSGRFVYMPGLTASSIAGFTIDQSSGALSPISGSPFAFGAGSPYASMTFSPSGNFAYVASGGNGAAGTVTVFTIDQTSGALAPIAGSSVATGVYPQNPVTDSSGSFLFLANTDGGTISAYAINPTSGALTPVVGSPFVTGFGPWGLAVVPIH